MKKGIYSLLIVLTIASIFTINAKAQEIKVKNEYNITIIEDGEEVPLAAEMSEKPIVFSAITSFAFLIIALLFVISIYMLQCYKYRERIHILIKKDYGSKKNDEKISWNVFQLKDLESQLEHYLASSIRID